MSYTIKGYTIQTAKTLNSIGNMAFWYDYRMGMNTVESGGQKRILSASDMSGSTSGVQLPTGDLALATVSDFGITAASGSTSTRRYLESKAKFPVISQLHKGAPFLVFSVFRRPTNSVGDSILFQSGTVGVGPGIRFASVSTGSLRVQFITDAGVLGAEHNITGITDNTHRLFAWVYYGTGTTNNSKLIYGSNTTFNTRSTAATGTHAQCRIAHIVHSMHIKNVGAYDLSGMNASQVNAFVTEFISVLKADPEYSNLITP